MRKLTILGTSFLAILVLSISQSSIAAAEEFHGEESPLTLSGSQTTTNIIQTDAGEITCKKATFTGTTSGVTTTEQELAPAFEECHAIFFGITIGISLDMNGCHFYLRWHIPPVGIRCPKGKKIELTAPGCTTSIEESGNEGLSSATYTNEGTGSGRSLIVDLNITNITYEETPSGTNTCASANKLTTGGKYTGSFTVSAKNGANVAKGIWSQ